MSSLIAGILSAIPAEVWTAIGATLVGAITTWLNGRRKRKQGREETLNRIEEIDHDQAEEVRDRLRRIDHELSAVERLRRFGRWRGPPED